MDRSHRPHSPHPNRHRPDEIKFINDMRRRNPNADEYSRFRYLEAFKEHNSFSSSEFIKHCIKGFPYAYFQSNIAEGEMLCRIGK